MYDNTGATIGNDTDLVTTEDLYVQRGLRLASTGPRQNKRTVVLQAATHYPHTMWGLGAGGGGGDPSKRLLCAAPVLRRIIAVVLCGNCLLERHGGVWGGKKRESAQEREAEGERERERERALARVSLRPIGHHPRSCALRTHMHNLLHTAASGTRSG